MKNTCDDQVFTFGVNTIPSDITVTVRYPEQVFEHSSETSDDCTPNYYCEVTYSLTMDDSEFDVVLETVDYFDEVHVYFTININGCTEEFNNVVVSSIMDGYMIDGESSPAYLSDLYYENMGYYTDEEHPLLRPDLAEIAHQHIGLKGTLIIDEDYSFYGDASAISRIQMFPGAKIIVDNNTALEIDKTNIVGDCATWNKIKVKQGGNIEISNTRVNDAVRAIELSNSASISANNNKFKNNFTTVYIPPSSQKKEVSFDRFYSNDIYSIEGETTPPYPGQDEDLELEERPFAGMELHDVKMAKFNGYFGKNTFDRLANGILSYNSTLIVENAEFTDIQPVLDETFPHAPVYVSRPPDEHSLAILGHNYKDFSTQLIVRDCSISDVPKAILSRETNTGILDNTISDAEVGIQCDYNDWQFVVIRNNDVNTRQRGLRLLNSTPMFVSNIEGNIIQSVNEDESVEYVGIEISEVKQHAAPERPHDWLIKDNTIMTKTSQYMYKGIDVMNASGTDLINNLVEINNAGYSGNMYGIFIQGGRFLIVDENEIHASDNNESYGMRIEGMSSSDVKCNEVYDYEEGINFYGMCQPIFFGDNYIDQMSNTGLLLGNKASDDGMAWIGPQVLRGNDWSGTYVPGTYGAQHLASNDPIIYKASRFKRNTPLPKHAPNDWFVSNSGTMFSCSEGKTGGPGIDQLDSFDIQLTNGDTVGGPYPVTSTWIAERNLYTRMLEDDSLRQANTQSQLFYTDIENTPKGDLAETEYDLSEGVSQILEDHEGTEVLLDSLMSITDQLIENDSARAACGTCPDSADLADTHDSLLSVYYSDAESLKDSMEVIENEHETLLETAQSDLSNIAPTETPGNSEKWVLSLYYALHPTGSPGNFEQADSLLEVHRDSLLTMATNCPMEHGRAVYIARSLLSLDSMYSFDIANDCQFAGGSRKRMSAPDILLYPNPTAGTVHLQSNSSLKITSCSVIGLNGKEIMRKNTDGMKEDFMLDQSSGIYFMRILMEDGRIVHRSIILQK